jgi:hypothetical protein
LRLWLSRRRWLCRWGWRNCNGWAAWPGLNGWSYGLLRAAARDGNPSSGDDAHCNRPCSSADEEVASRGKRAHVLATG